MTILSGWQEQYERMLRSHKRLTNIASGQAMASSDEARDALFHFFQDAYHVKDWINLPSGLLIYAKGEAPSASHSIPLAGKTIEVRTLDLDGTPESSLRQIDEIAYKVRSLAGQQSRSAA